MCKSIYTSSVRQKKNPLDLFSCSYNTYIIILHFFFFFYQGQPFVCQTMMQPNARHNCAERSKRTDFRSNEPVYLACQNPNTHGSGLISLLRQSRSLVFQQSLKFPSAAEAPISLFPPFLQRASQDLYSLLHPDTLTSVFPSPLLRQQMFIYTDDPFFLLFNYSLSSC